MGIVFVILWALCYCVGVVFVIVIAVVFVIVWMLCHCIGVVFVIVWGLYLLLCGGCVCLSFLFDCSNLIT